MSKLTKEDIKKIKELRALFPKIIRVKVIPCEEGGYTIRIREFPQAITQADNLTDLIVMVSDCVATVLNVPQKYLPFMPNYLPSVELAKYLNKFPCPRVTRKGEFSVVGPHTTYAQ